MRHAMASHPHSAYFFHLDPHALIMNPSKSFHSHILEKSELESRMLKDVSVIPPDSVIKTFSHLKASDIDLIITRDKEDLNPGSFVLRQGDFASFFLDLWFDPLFRAYNYAKAEVHALVCRLTLNICSFVLTVCPGSHSTMASNRSRQNGYRPPTDVERL